MKRLLLAALLLTGCTTTKEVYTPDGRMGLAITCSGNWANCLQKAGERCRGAGYDVYMRDSTTGQVAVINYTRGLGLQGYSNTTRSREMLIACRGD